MKLKVWQKSVIATAIFSAIITSFFALNHIDNNNNSNNITNSTDVKIIQDSKNTIIIENSQDVHIYMNSTAIPYEFKESLSHMENRISDLERQINKRKRIF